MLYRIFGKSGHGKTHYIFEKLRECIDTRTHAFLIVPEQGAVKTETEVISTLGNSSNLYVEVINFKRLCNRVFRETGGLSTSHTAKSADSIIMSFALAEISDFLTRYKDSAANPDFVKKALESLKELSNANVTSKQLEECIDVLSGDEQNAEICAKLCDINLILQAFENQKKELTGEKLDIYDKLCERLEESAFFADKCVFIDGFYGFTAKELKIISLIAEDARDVYVTLPYDGKTQDDVFSRSIHASKLLEKLSERIGVQLCDVFLQGDKRHTEGSALYAYCNEFESKSITAPPKSLLLQGMEIYSCRDIYSQARAAAAIVFELIRGGAKFSDICITAKSIQEYDGILDAIFKKCGFPLSLDHPEKLCDTALFNLIASAFSAVGARKNDAGLSYIKSGLSGLSDMQADVLETYMRTWNLKTDSLLRETEWGMNPKGFTEAPADEGLLREINAAKSSIYMCLSGFELALKSAQTVKDFSGAVWTLLCDIANVSGKDSFDDRAEGLHLDLLCRCLDDLVSTAGQKKTNTVMFLQLLNLCAEQCDTGKIPERLDCVMFSPVELVRASNVKHIIILGANDGIFPSAVPVVGLFNDRERPLLYENGIKLSEPYDKAAFDDLFLAYSAICSARDSAYILYSLQTVKGEKLYPSCIVQSTEALTGAKTKAFSESDFADSFCADEVTLEDYLISSDTPQARGVKNYLSEREISKKLSDLSMRFTEQDTLSKETLSALYTDKIVTSYSKLEKFNQCPFSHFCTYSLNLRPEPKAKLDALNAGSVMHKILELFVPRAAQAKKDGTPFTKEQGHELVLSLLEEYFKVLTHGCDENISKRFAHLYGRLSRALFAAADAILEELQASSFEMCEFELSVSQNEGLKPCPIDIGDGVKLYIIGQIDRVDRYVEDGVAYIRIVDYKTGSKSFKTDDVLSGFNLQMLLYMYSVCNSQTKLLGDTIIPAGIMYYRVYSGDEKMPLGYDDAALAEKTAPKAKTDGRFLDRPSILLAMDSTQSARFIPIKYDKDGQVIQSDYLLKLESMGRLINFAAGAAAQLAKRIYNGEKDITPFVDKNLDACLFCDMLPVCQGHKKERYMGDLSSLKEEILGHREQQ